MGFPQFSMGFPNFSIDFPRISRHLQVPATVPGRVLELCRLLAEAQRVERELRKAAAEAHGGAGESPKSEPFMVVEPLIRWIPVDICRS